MSVGRGAPGTVVVYPRRAAPPVNPRSELCENAARQPLPLRITPAIAFVGGPGAGKSTTAACFALRGFSVLSDDVSAIDNHGDGFSVRPAYPHLRLWPASVPSVLGPEALRPITPNWDKRRRAQRHARKKPRTAARREA
jgi:hypothetical protein